MNKPIFPKYKIYLILAWIIVLAFTGNVFAEHDIYLETPNSIPSYCQETNIWCGAATAQMILEGYPGGVEHQFTQTFIWNTIQGHLDDPGVNWATDPDGMRDTLMDLGGDPGVNWNIHDDPSAQNLTYSVTYWMTRRSYPTAVLVYGFQHWVMIDGFTTDVDPTQQTTINLQLIEIVDPWNPPCPNATSGGVRTLMSGTNWYGNYWYTTGNYPASKWDGNYIAVIEPPIKTGIAKAPKLVEKGIVISKDEAKENAMRWFKRLRIEQRAPYKSLRMKKPLEPFLVNQEYKGYYIVPLGYIEGKISQGAVLVNAYDGSFQEIGVFMKPIQYLSQDQAIKIAIKYLCSCKYQKEELKIELMFEPSQQTQSRFLPLWKVTYKGITLYITQDGRVFEKLTPLPLGD